MCSDLVNSFEIYVSEITTDMSRCNKNPVRLSLMTYHRLRNNSNTKGATSGA